MKLIIYDTKLTYTHRIKDESWLVDKSCCVDHTHIDVKIHIEFSYDKMVDFKTIKEHVEFIISDYHNQNITDKFSISTTEQFVDLLVLRLGIKLHPNIDIKTFILQETEKYGIKYVSN